MKSYRFPMTITLDFEVPYWQNVSGLTDQQLANYVVSQTLEERNELVIEAKVLLIHALAGEFTGSDGLPLEPGDALALGDGTVQTEDEQKVGWFGRLFGFISAKREDT